MPKNLREKVALVLADCENLKQFELIQRLERIVLEELNYLTNEHKLDVYELTTIRSRAIAMYGELNMSEKSLGKLYGDSEMVRHYCMVQATVEYFRNKGLIGFTAVLNTK